MRKWSRSTKDNRAEMGVGTLIIFIAMVLVAAVAASVLINVVDKLQEQATGVADDTQEYFGTQLFIYNVNAEDDDADGDFDRLVIGIMPSFSSGPVDTTKVWVVLNEQVFYYNSYLEEIGQVSEDEQQNRFLYEFVWHNPSPKEYADGDPYLYSGQTGIIIIDFETIGYQTGDQIEIKIFVENGLSTGKNYKP